MSAADEAGVDVDIVKYMLKAERPDRATLESIVAKLEDPVEDLVRKDAQFAKLDLDADALVGDAGAVVDVLVDHPQLLQRPVLVKGDRAIIGRPKDRVPEFLSS